MNKALALAGIAACLLPVAAGAAAPKKPASKMAKAPVTLKCPSCNMQMPNKATKMFPVPVNVKGKGTFYCCTECKSGKAAMKAMKMTSAKAKSAKAKSAKKKAM